MQRGQKAPHRDARTCAVADVRRGRVPRCGIPRHAQQVLTHWAGDCVWTTGPALGLACLAPYLLCVRKRMLDSCQN